VSEALAVPESNQVATVNGALSVVELVGQADLIKEAMRAVMTNGEHYGVIPGTKKPTLLKPGAEKLCLLFRLDPEYPPEQVKEVWHPDGHYTVTAICTLYHILSGNRIASGLGLCSTREEKYAYRNAERVCPDCGVAAIVRSKKKSAFFCIRDKGGCGHRFAFGTVAGDGLEGQDAGKKPNENLPDTYNTVLKMACKRALVAAVLNGTAASDIFTQDLDDTDETLSEGGRSEAAQPTETGRDAPVATPSESAADLSKLIEVMDTLAPLSVPEGHKSWDDLAGKYAKDNFNVRGGDATKLKQEQVDELVQYLESYTVPV
jgi:hypothetical protein